MEIEVCGKRRTKTVKRHNSSAMFVSYVARPCGVGKIRRCTSRTRAKTEGKIPNVLNVINTVESVY